EDEVLDVEDASSFVGAFQEGAEADELPGLIVAHGDVEDAVDEVAAHADLVAEGGQVGGFALAAFGGEEQVEAVDLLPHFRGDGFADATGVFARRENSGKYGIGILRIEGEKAHHAGLRGCAVAFEKGSAVAGGVHDGLPLIGEVLRQVEHQIVIDVEEAGDVFGAFDVAAEPVDGVGDPAEQGYGVCHGYCCWPPPGVGEGAARTQVSLLPPPCEELTTSEPLRMATRVRPPGST